MCCSPWGGRVGHNLVTEQQQQQLKISSPPSLNLPSGSDSKDSACNAEDLGSIQVWKYFKGTGNKEQFFLKKKKKKLNFPWTFLVAQGVKNLPAMQKTWVQSLGPEDPLEKGMATHSNILDWKILWTEKLTGYSQWDRKELDTSKQLIHIHHESNSVTLAIVV